MVVNQILEKNQKLLKWYGRDENSVVEWCNEWTPKYPAPTTQGFQNSEIEISDNDESF